MDGVADPGQLVFGQGQTGRQVKPAPGEPLRDRITLVEKKTAPVKGRLLVHPEEERTRLDALLSETGGKLCAVQLSFFSEHKPVHPENTAGPGLFNRQRQMFDIFQPSRVLVPERSLARDDLVHTLDLRDAKRGLQICQTKICAKLFVINTARGLEGQIP